MNLSLARDILRRNNHEPQRKEPAGCCGTWIERIVSGRSRSEGVPVGIVMEHRFAFWMWMRIKREMQYDSHFQQWIPDKDFLPPDLLTMDRHDDVGGESDCIKDELRRLNQDDENEVGFYCWAGLWASNAAQIAPAIWLNVINNVYVVLEEYEDDEELRRRPFTDRYGRRHWVTYVRTPEEFDVEWAESMAGDGLIWDIDLDYFTTSKDTGSRHVTERFADDAIAGLLDLDQEWLQMVLKSLQGVTIALEPEFTGGLDNSLHLLRQWEKAVLTAPLFEDGCALKDVFG